MVLPLWRFPERIQEGLGFLQRKEWFFSDVILVNTDIVTYLDIHHSESSDGFATTSNGVLLGPVPTLVRIGGSGTHQSSSQWGPSTPMQPEGCQLGCQLG